MISVTSRRSLELHKGKLFAVRRKRNGRIYIRNEFLRRSPNHGHSINSKQSTAFMRI
jgi:hypothetical protein